MSTALNIAQMLDGKDITDMASGVPDEIRGMTPEELQKFVTILDAHLRSIHQEDNGELRVKDDAEQTAFDYGLALRDRALNRLEEHRKVAEVFTRRPQAVKQAMASISYGSEPGSDIRRMSIGEARDAALRVLDNRNWTTHLQDEQKVHVERQIRRDTDIARRLLVTETEAYRTAFQKLVTDPNANLILSDEERDAVRAWYEYRALSEVAPGSAGGYGIPVFIDPSIILTSQGSGNPFLTIARQVQVQGNAWKGVSSAGVSWSFDAEATAVSDDSPAMAQPAVNVFTARGFIPYSIEIGQDYPGFADEMATLLGDGYDELLVDKFSRGTGTNEPQGVLTALDADTTSEVLLTTAGALGEVDIYRLWAALPQRFRARATWMMSVGVNNAIRRMGTADLFHASTINLQEEFIDRLFNRQVYESPYFPDAVGTTGHTNQIVVGDFNNYVVARRGGMTVELVPQLFDVTNNMPTGQRGWFAWARIGGGVASTKSFKLLNQT